MDDSGDDDNVRAARYSELLKSFQIEGYVDEFRISGKQVMISDYHDDTLHHSGRGGGGRWFALADHSCSLLFRRASVLLVCAGLAYLAFWALHRYRNNDKHRKIERIKRKRQPKANDVKSKTHIRHVTEKEPTANSNIETKKDALEEASPARKMDTPDLVVEKVDHLGLSEVLAHAPCGKMPLVHAQPSFTTDTLETDFVKTAQSFRKIIENSGMGGSDEMALTLSWQAAMTLKQTAAICQATAMAESRGYIFHAQQRSLDRKIGARQHQELLTSIREDRSWSSRLVEARDACFAALRIASLRCFAVILGFKPFVMTTRLLFRCRSHSVSDLVFEVTDLLTACPQTGDGLSKTIGFSLQPSYWFLSYVDSYLNGASCVASNAATVSYVLLFCSAAGLISRAFGLPSMSTTLVVCFLAFSESFLTAELLTLLAIVLAATLVTASYVMIQFWTLKRIFNIGKHVPSNQLVSESLIRFSRATDLIQLCPLLLAIWLSSGYKIHN